MLITRRALLLAPLAVLRPQDAHAAGVHLTGRLTATETERLERYVAFGSACAIVVNDTALWDAIHPLIGHECQFSLFKP